VRGDLGLVMSEIVAVVVNRHGRRANRPQVVAGRQLDALRRLEAVG
jgi:hypothetical protein